MYCLRREKLLIIQVAAIVIFYIKFSINQKKFNLGIEL